MDDVRTFESGARRQALEHEVRFDLISPYGLRRLAETYAEGAMKYDDHNWRKGMPFSSLLNHALNHINQYLQGDRTEDHLAHAAWSLFAVMEFESTRPAQNDLYDFYAEQSAAVESFCCISAMAGMDCNCKDAQQTAAEAREKGMPESVKEAWDKLLYPYDLPGIGAFEAHNLSEYDEEGFLKHEPSDAHVHQMGGPCSPGCACGNGAEPEPELEFLD